MTIAIPGARRGKQRPRVVHASGVSRGYTPEMSASYEHPVRLEYQRQRGGEFIADGPLSVHIDDRFAVSRSASRRTAAAMRAGTPRPTRKPEANKSFAIRNRQF